MDQRSIDSPVDLLLLLQAMGNLLGEVQAEVANGLTLEHLLWLVELLSHESIEVIVEDEVLELGQLLGEKLLLDLVEHIVSLVVLKVTLHVDLLLELSRHHQDILLVIILVGEELLVTELEHLRVLVVDVVDVLVKQVDGLLVLLQDELGSLDLTLLVQIWNDEDLIKSGPPDSLSVLREEQLLATDHLNDVLLVVAELDAVLSELQSACSWVSTLVVLHEVLSRDLILGDLEDWVSVSGEEPLLLVEDLRGPGESVAGESSLSLADVLSQLKIGVDAALLDDFHLLDVEDQQAVALLDLSILVDKWDELDLSLHVIECLKGQVNIVVLGLLLELNEVLEGHVPSKALQDGLLGALERTAEDHSDWLFHLDERQDVVKAHLLDLLDQLLHEEVVVLAVELLSFVDEGEAEHVVRLGPVIHDQLHILIVVVKLNPDVDVLAVLGLYNHEGILVILLNSVSEEAAHPVELVHHGSGDVGLRGDEVLVLLVQVVALALSLDFLG